MTLLNTTVAYATDPALSVEMKEFLIALNTSGGKPMETMSPSEARKVLEGAQTSVIVDLSGVMVTKKTIHADEIEVNIFVVRSCSGPEVPPAFMFFHGGGWVIGDFSTHERFVRDLVIYSGAAAVVVEYTLSPEAKYPRAVDEVYAATKWVAEHGAEIGVDGSRLAVVGNSAGGNLAAATALKALHLKGPALRFQLLFWPVTNADFDTESYHEFATDRFLTRNMMMWFWDHYASHDERMDIYASPLQGSVEDLRGLPPTLIQTAQNDVLRDEGEAYARKLNQAGVAVTLTRLQGLIHDYGLLNPLAATPAVQSALRAAAAELKYALA